MLYTDNRYGQEYNIRIEREERVLYVDIQNTELIMRFCTCTYTRTHILCKNVQCIYSVPALGVVHKLRQFARYVHYTDVSSHVTLHFEFERHIHISTVQYSPPSLLYYTLVMVLSVLYQELMSRRRQRMSM